MCMVDGCDPNRVSRQITRKARKAHACQECGRQIAAGESYTYDSGIDSEGSAFSHKTCSHCHVVVQWLVVNCGGTLMHGVYEDIREHFDEYQRMDIARLVVGMERDWQRFKSGSLMPLPKLPRPIELGDAR